MDVEHSRTSSAVSLLNLNSSAILSAPFLSMLRSISQANVAMSSNYPLNRFPPRHVSIYILMENEAFIPGGWQSVSQLGATPHEGRDLAD